MTYLTTKDLQELIRVDKSTIYRMAEDGRIPAVKIGRQWRFPEDAVRQMLGDVPFASAPVVERPSLLGSLDPAVPQAVAELAAETLGAMVVITGMDGVPITEVANPCGLFSAVASEPTVFPRCIDTWAHYGDEPDLVPAFRPSQFGFLCARTFIRVGNELLGMMIVGGLATPDWPPPASAIEMTADGFGVDRDLVRSHIDEVYHLDDVEKERILDLLPRFGVLLSRISAASSSLVGRLDAIASLVGDIEDTRSTP
jgi:excisionase family DNA binding protein